VATIFYLKQEHCSTASSGTIAASSAAVYYAGSYWNDFEETRCYMNALATDEPSMDWKEHLFHWNNGRPFRKALILSCGNGFVERTLFDMGIILSAVGIDINNELLDRARTQARAGSYPFTYFSMDSNKRSTFPAQDFDIVINHAALHHIAYIDFHLRALHDLLKKSGGVIVNYDFVGPHRNQYSDKQWKAMTELNERSNSCFRHPHLRYPHLPTMLRMDPSEAIHSELIVQTLLRYFEPVWFRYLNGQLAYGLLTHNSNLQTSSCSATSNLSEHISWILKSDAEFALSNDTGAMFMYSIMKPRSFKSFPSYKLDKWKEEERRRENAARQNHGLYYGMTRPHLEQYGNMSDHDFL
jgi:ubiquinone/menaquinone biosynthesis C-methylase UbiE